MFGEQLVRLRREFHTRIGRISSVCNVEFTHQKETLDMSQCSCTNSAQRIASKNKRGGRICQGLALPWFLCFLSLPGMPLVNPQAPLSAEPYRMLPELYCLASRSSLRTMRQALRRMR